MNDGKKQEEVRDKRVTLSVRDYLSVCEVAGRLGLCERTVISRIKDGTIRATKIGGIWRIKFTDLEFTMDRLKNENCCSKHNNR